MNNTSLANQPYRHRCRSKILPKPRERSRKAEKADQKAKVEPLQRKAAKRKRGARDEVYEEVGGSEKKISKRRE